MNKVILIGRIVKDPVLYGEGASLCAKYTLAVNRIRYPEECDFISCVAFGRNAEVAERYFTKGLKVAITGSILSGNYINQYGKKVYTTSVKVDTQEFVERMIKGECND